ncbi:MAG: TetR/AcrR family transcriptional regulator [candidate division KSB1 bacterium]|nr:TetR/AcrR family transcriptional regulator [candidate division KSB1 bacterium]
MYVKSQKEKKRRKILKAAIKLFAEKGFHQTTIDDIADAAGIGKGTVYEYFNSKIDFVNEIYKIYCTPSQKMQMRLKTNDVSPLEKIQTLLPMLLYDMNTNMNLNRIVLQLWLENGAAAKEAGMDMAKLYRDARLQSESLLKAAIDAGQIRKDIPEFTSMIILAILEGLSLQLLAEPDSYDLDKLSDSILDFILNGIKNN